MTSPFESRTTGGSQSGQGVIYCPTLPEQRTLIAESLSEIIEGDTTLAADDYELRSSGNVVRRLDDGTNPASYWRNRVYVTYLPQSDLALRAIAQLELVRLEIAFNPLLVSQTIGSWTETYQQGKSYPEQRADILAALSPQPVGVW